MHDKWQLSMKTNPKFYKTVKSRTQDYRECMRHSEKTGQRWYKRKAWKREF